MQIANMKNKQTFTITLVFDFVIGISYMFSDTKWKKYLQMIWWNIPVALY